MPQDSKSQPVREMAVAGDGGGDFLDYAEMTSCSCKFTDPSKDDVEAKANGYIRELNRTTKLVSLGWVDSIKADNDAQAAPAFVVLVMEISSSTAGAAPRSYSGLEYLESPPELKNAVSPAAVFCALEPGDATNPPATHRMKRVRIPVA